MSAADPPLVELSLSRRPLRAAVVAVRPRQWTKNLLLFAGIVFSGTLGDAGRLVDAVVAFVAWCLASSAAYLVNDLRDRPADRRHPAKRARPIASGELPPRTAVALAAVLVVGAVALVVPLGAPSVACLAGFLALQVAYTYRLKRYAVVDVFAIAVLFVLRAAAGAIAVSVVISPWLLACTGLLALFLALGKRRAELVGTVAGSVGGRETLAAYDLRRLDRALEGVAIVTVATYAAYALLSDNTLALVATVPFVAAGVWRYLRLVRLDGRGEEPERILLGDLPTMAIVGGWALTCALLVALTS